MPHYVRSGVRHLWIVDPGARMLEIYRPEGGHWTLLGTHSDDDKARGEPFDAIEIDPPGALGAVKRRTDPWSVR